MSSIKGFQAYLLVILARCADAVFELKEKYAT